MDKKEFPLQIEEILQREGMTLYPTNLTVVDAYLIVFGKKRPKANLRMNGDDGRTFWGIYLTEEYGEKYKHIGTFPIGAIWIEWYLVKNPEAAERYGKFGFHGQVFFETDIDHL